MFWINFALKLFLKMSISVERIESLDDERVRLYRGLSDGVLRSDGVFVAESPKVIGVALDAGYEALSVLCEERHIEGDAAGVLSRMGDEVRVFTGSREVLEGLTGYRLTRGVLCVMRRGAGRDVGELCDGARRVCVIDGVCDTTNIGSIFRSAAALGIDAVFLTRGSCDPLNRRSVRVSMGSVFLVRWGWIDSALDLGSYGFRSVALALRDDSVGIDDAVLKGEERLAIVLGTEGDGLSDDVISGADYVARIPMSYGVDSLNVGAAAAVAFWELRWRR